MLEQETSYYINDWLKSKEAFVEEYLKYSTIRSYQKQDVICNQGDLMDAFYLVIEGIIECSFRNEHGQKKIVGLVDKGMLIGMSGLDSYREHHTFSCRTPAIVAVMQKERINEWSREMLYSLIHMQTEKMRSAISHILGQYLDPVEARIARLLLEAGTASASIANVDIPMRVTFSKKEISEIVGSTRERVSQVMSEMQRSGAFTLKGKEVLFYSSALKKFL